MPIESNRVVKHNKPDIVLFDNSNRVVIIAEVAVSWYTRLELQTQIKQNRYATNENYDEELNVPYPRGENLVKQLSLKGWNVKFGVIVIGACGESLPTIVEELDKIEINGKEAFKLIERMSRAAVLGSNRIIKQHLV